MAEAVELGNRAASAVGLEAAYHRLYATAVRWAVLVTRDVDAAEDVAQEAFVKVFSRVRPYAGDEGLDRYLRRAVVNGAITWIRSEQRHRAREMRAVEQGRGQSTEVDADTELWHRVRRLPKRQATAVALRYWMDLSEAETARLMRCRVGTVKSLTNRAITTLRTEAAGD